MVLNRQKERSELPVVSLLEYLPPTSPSPQILLSLWDPWLLVVRRESRFIVKATNAISSNSPTQRTPTLSSGGSPP